MGLQTRGASVVDGLVVVIVDGSIDSVVEKFDVSFVDSFVDSIVVNSVVGVSS